MTMEIIKISGFNSQPLEGGCLRPRLWRLVQQVSTHSRSKAAAQIMRTVRSLPGFQLTAARRRLLFGGNKTYRYTNVSTHSRSKAAAILQPATGRRGVRFNSQPLEGGCHDLYLSSLRPMSFNSQPLEGGCRRVRIKSAVLHCFNSQPLEGGCLSGL